VGLLLATSLVVSPLAAALEYPIGKPQLREGMEVAAVYLQPVAMSPRHDARGQGIGHHIEADVKATDKNRNASRMGPGSRISTSSTS